MGWAKVCCLAGSVLFAPLAQGKSGQCESVKRQYPEAARQAGAQGMVLLRLQLDAQGRLESTRLEVSSGYEELDQLALQMAQCQRIDTKAGAARTVWLPINFRLD